MSQERQQFSFPSSFPGKSISLCCALIKLTVGAKKNTTDTNFKGLMHNVVHLQGARARCASISLFDEANLVLPLVPLSAISFEKETVWADVLTGEEEG